MIRCEDCGKELSGEELAQQDNTLCDECWHKSFEDFLEWQQEGGRYPEGYRPL